MTFIATPQASYIIPFRATDELRLQNLVAVLEWLDSFSGLEIIVVEQDSQSRMGDALDKYAAHYSLQEQSGPFNKSAALNRGVQLANSDILVLADADMIISHEALELSITACQDHADAVNPYTHLFDLSESQRDAFLSNNTLPKDSERVISKRQREGEQLCFCGGIFLMKKNVYQRIGGMDEAFQGWGGEDDAMSIKIEKFDTDRLIKHSQTAFHLWHNRDQESRYSQTNYQSNVDLLRFYKRSTPEDLKQYVQSSKSLQQ